MNSGRRNKGSPRNIAFNEASMCHRGKRRDRPAPLARLLALQAFYKPFQINAVPMPSFSKECFGGFVEFQSVTIDPNHK
jgi:hypothetical protein